MNLRDLAAADTKKFLTDTKGFGVAITLTSPAGVVTELTGYSTDISLGIDPETGVTVSSRQASVALAYDDLTEIPVNIPSEASKPWLVTFVDPVKGAVYEFRVLSSIPDRAIGSIVLMLEQWR